MQVVILDVRPVLAAGGEPFDAIMSAAATLPQDGVLQVIAPFEPVPLYGVLGAQGFDFRTERRAAAEYVVRFSRTSASLHDEAATFRPT